MTSPPPTTTVAETMKEKMNEILSQFQNALDSDGWKVFVTTAKKNVEEMKKLAANGQQELLKQLKKTNDEVIEKLKAAHTETTKKLRTEFDQLKAQTGDQRDKALAEFKLHYEEAIKKVGDEGSKAFQGALKELKDFKGKTDKDYEKFLKSIDSKFDTSFEETLKKLSI